MENKKQLKKHNWLNRKWEGIHECQDCGSKVASKHIRTVFDSDCATYMEDKHTFVRSKKDARLFECSKCGHTSRHMKLQYGCKVARLNEVLQNTALKNPNVIRNYEKIFKRVNY